MRSSFWLKRHKWPTDAAEHIFLGQAVLEIGRHLFPDSWSDDDPGYFIRSKPRALPPSLDVIASESGIHVPPNEELMSEEQIARENECAMLSLLRFGIVQNVLTDAAQHSDGIRTFFLPLGGYGFNPMPREWWQVRNPNIRFDFCEVNTSHPADPASAGVASPWAYIFVSKDDLKRLISPPTPLTRTPHGLGRPSKTDHILHQFAERVRSGTVELRPAWEGKEIHDADMQNPHRANPKVIADRIRSFHKMIIRDSAGLITNKDEVIRAILGSL